MSEPNFNAELTEFVTDYEIEFSDFIILYRGVDRTWIGDGTSSGRNAGESGVLYAEMVDGDVQEVGPVSSYYYALSAGFQGSFSNWVQTILDTTVNAANAAQSASDALASERAASGSESAARAAAEAASQSSLAAQGYKNEAKLWANYGADGDVPSASNNAKAYATAASGYATAASDAITKQPRINSTTNTWELWDAQTGSWVVTEYPVTGDSGVYYGAEQPEDPAVNVWIDPSGTQTFTEINDSVGEGVLNKTWSADKITRELDEKAAAIIGEETKYSHTNVDLFTINGNQYAFGNAKYADRKNLIVGYDGSKSVTGMTILMHDNFVLIDGTPSGVNDFPVWVDDTVDISEGTYVFKVEPYVGSSTLSNGKSIHIDFWYDGNTSDTYDLRVSLSGVKDVAVSSTLTLTDHVYKIRVWSGYAANVYNGYRLFYSLLPSDVTIVDTNETISASGTLDISLQSEMSVVDTLMHKSTVTTIIDTKTYVDNHTQEIDFVCFRPEDFGAKGDGVTDDSAALQACIDAAQEYDYNKGKCIRGYGTYYLSTGIVFNCRELDVFLNKIIYIGNDAAVTISASYSRFVFQSIRTTGGGNSAVGIKCYQTADGLFYHNEIRCGFIYTNGNTVLLTRSNNVVTNSMMYNQFYFEYQRSVNANIIEVATQNCNENDFHGKLVHAQNGYLIHFAQDCYGGFKMYNYCLENYINNGTNGTTVKFIDCRFSEMQNLRTISENTKGYIFKWENCASTGMVINPSGGAVNLTCVDPTGANSWQDCLDKVKATFDNGETDNSLPWSNCIPSASGSYPFFAMLSPVTCVANANMVTNGGAVHIPEGKMIVYYNNIAYKPNSEIYKKVTSNMTISLSATNDWDYITPTVFDIDTTSATITLDASYCCLAIDEFDVIQHTGKEAVVVDKLGNTIFNGIGLGAGTFHFKCSMVQYGYHEISVTLENGTVKYCPTGLSKSIYSGTNEMWTVIKDSVDVAPTADAQEIITSYWG